MGTEMSDVSLAEIERYEKADKEIKKLKKKIRELEKELDKNAYKLYN